MNKMVQGLTAVLLAASALAASAASITLTGTVRDFHPDGANFEGSIVGGAGMVAGTLSGASPTLTAYGSTVVSETGAGAFGNWYTRPTDSLNYGLTLTETSPGSGIYTYASSDFFPIDGQLYGNEGQAHNYHFTYAINSTFSYVKGAGQVFSFTGDDDVWVYFDNLLGIDLGGVHGALSQTVNLDTLFSGANARDSGDYAFNFFFAERHTTQSNLQITTSLVIQENAVPEPGSLALAGLALMGLGFARRRAARR